MSRDRFCFALAIGASSVLLFSVQPIVAKAILPKFGGSAGVWVTCMLFFQVVLLAGYLYSFALNRTFNRRAQVAAHMMLLAAGGLLLPWKLRAAAPAEGASPVPAILLFLAGTIGLPFFVLSANSPLLQSWYAATPGARFPYGLFAWSNLASLLALLAYPVLLEPMFATLHLLRWWSGAYLLLALLIAFTAGSRALARQAPPGPADASEPAALRLRALLWTGLSACASALWLAAANHLSQEVAAVPFLWILPLSVYLLAFILCFEGRGWYRPEIFRALMPGAWCALAYGITLRGAALGLAVEIPMVLAALLACCMFCDGELVLSRPESPSEMPFFYLAIALGGALGAVFVAVVAPVAFNRFLELPIAVTACVLLGFRLLYRYPVRRLLRLAVIAVLAFVVATGFDHIDHDIARSRNFYGSLLVSDKGDGPAAARTLFNGRTLHGAEFLSPELSRNPTAYYGPQSGVGLALAALRMPARRVGVVGLGVGTLAAYGRTGDRFRFYEINPAVVDAASRHFRFLRESAAQTEVVTADGRLAIEREPRGSFDVLVLDAFADDSIPVHLLTREAFELYFDHLRGDGVVLVHMTNRYLDLAPVVQACASALGRRFLLIRSAADDARQIRAADWAVVGRDQPLLATLAVWSQPAPARGYAPWTDGRSDLFRLLK
jgi:hypothetical protein